MKLLIILFITCIIATTTQYVLGQPVVQIRPEIQNIFNELTKNYPVLSQNDINLAHKKLIQDCIAHGDPNNFFMEFVCAGQTSGMMQDYLEVLGYKFDHSSEAIKLRLEGQTPQLIN